MQITNTWQIAAMLNIMKSVNSKYNCTKNKQSTILAMWRHFAVSLEIKKNICIASNSHSRFKYVQKDETLVLQHAMEQL